MNLKNKILKNNIVNLKKIHYSKWNKNIFKYLLFLLTNDNYKSYKDILIIIFDEFIFFNEHGGGYLFNVDNLKKVKNKLKFFYEDKQINLIEYYNSIEKISRDKENKEKIELQKKVNAEIKCKEIDFNNIFDYSIIDFFDFKFFGFVISIFIILFVCMIKNLLYIKSDFQKKNTFQFKIPFDDNIITNTILKYFLGENFSSE